MRDWFEYGGMAVIIVLLILLIIGAIAGTNRAYETCKARGAVPVKAMNGRFVCVKEVTREDQKIQR